MGTELILTHASTELLQLDFADHLRKGRAFVPGDSGLTERDLCTLRIEHPNGADAHRLRAEAVWIDSGTPGGTGLSFVGFDATAQEALRRFVASAVSGEPDAGTGADVAGDTPCAGSEPDPDSSQAAGNVHERIRALELAERDVLARQCALPERVALERRFGSSVWEALLHNPQVTPREVLRMAKSASLPTHLVALLVANRAWAADAAINQALLENPRVSGAHLDRLLRALPQAELTRVAEQPKLRLQVRQAAKRLIRR
jgi:hypothetical protein